MAPRNKTEKREADGVKYSKVEFIEFFGEKKGQKQWDAAAPESSKACSVCGKTNHTKGDCRLKDAECNNCGKTGHIAQVCKAPGGGAAKGADEDKPAKAAMKIELYSSYRCPFGRRALLAMEEKSLSYDFIPIPLSGELKKLDAGETELDGWEGKSPDELRKIKEDYKKDINASGEVPTLVVNGVIIKEADVIVEYLQDAFPRRGVSLMPRDALQRSKIRHYNKIIGGPGGVNGMYGLTMNQDPAKDEEFRKNVYAHWASFAEMAGDDGPFFLGKAFSLADVMLMPMYDQFSYVWPHYRGTELIPSDAEAYPWAPRVQKWADAVKERASFKKCHAGKETYIKAYGSYAGERGVVAKFGA